MGWGFLFAENWLKTIDTSTKTKALQEQKMTDDERINALTTLVSKLGDIGMTLSAQVFSVIGQVDHIEKHLRQYDKNYTPYIDPINQEADDETAKE